MSNTDTRTELEKLYDQAYETGWRHCQEMAEILMATGPINAVSPALTEYINEKFPKEEATS